MNEDELYLLALSKHSFKSHIFLLHQGEHFYGYGTGGVLP